MTATVYDVSVRGAGLLVSHIQAVALNEGATARVKLKLPGSKKELSGSARILHTRRLDQRDIVGLAFDLDDPEGFAQHEQAIAAYCSERLAEFARWEDGWQEDAA